jgi:hypothetical protein
MPARTRPISAVSRPSAYQRRADSFALHLRMGSAMNDAFDRFPTLQRCATDVITVGELRRTLATGQPMRISTEST